MAKHQCTIAGSAVELEWTQSVARQYRYRASKLGVDNELERMSNPATVESAVFDTLWCLLPSALIAKYPTPEELFVAVDHDNEAEGIWQAIKGVIEEQVVDQQKKTTSKSDPGPESS